LDAQKALSRAQKAFLDDQNALLEYENFHADHPEARWRPEYLGQPFVLSRSVPNYMPQQEKALMDGIDGTLQIDNNANTRPIRILRYENHSDSIKINTSNCQVIHSPRRSRSTPMNHQQMLQMHADIF